jgi:hypothetical protein
MKIEPNTSVARTVLHVVAIAISRFLLMHASFTYVAGSKIVASCYAPISRAGILTTLETGAVPVPIPHRAPTLLEKAEETVAEQGSRRVSQSVETD